MSSVIDKVAVVILNWNGKHFLEKFLPSVIEYSKEATIYIADNHSSDDSIDFLNSNYPTIKIIKNTKNEGFCDGYNKALKKIKANYYVLLNSDIEVTENWLPPLIKLLDSDISIAACQPKIKSYANKAYFEYAGAAGGFIDKYGYPFCRGRIFNSIEKDTGQYNDCIPIIWATGACMMIRSEMYHQAGGLDKDFFAHMEEIDLCWRLSNMGYQIYYCGESEIYHVGGGTLHKTNPKKTYLNFRNSFQVLCKNAPSKGLFNILLVRIMLDKLASIKFFLSFSWGSSVAVSKAYLYNLNKLTEIKSKRKWTSKKNYPSSTLMKSIAIEHFIKKKKVFKDVMKID